MKPFLFDLFCAARAFLGFERCHYCRRRFGWFEERVLMHDDHGCPRFTCDRWGCWLAANRWRRRGEKRAPSAGGARA